MVSAWLSFVFFILKIAFIAGSLFVLWQALRKEIKKKIVLLSMLAAGAVTGVLFAFAENSSLSAAYFADETQSNGDEAPTTHFTGDAPGVVPLADGQGAFMQKMFVIGSVVGAFLTLSVGCFLFGATQVSFQCSAVGICSALIGLTFL